MINDITVSASKAIKFINFSNYLVERTNFDDFYDIVKFNQNKIGFVGNNKMKIILECQSFHASHIRTLEMRLLLEQRNQGIILN